MGHNQIGKRSEILQFVAPGTELRSGLDNILRAKTGGLIVVGYNENMTEVVDGGFSINCSYSPAQLYELAKMDGALILSECGKRILYANTQLIPDPSTPSTETGMRHRTAERFAKQTGNLVIAISQRRNVITLYKGSFRYALKEIGVILTKANQAIQTLEKYKNVLDQSVTNLGALEFEQLVTYHEVTQVIHRVEMVLRIKREILNYINELGTEGRLISMQMKELLADVEHEAILLIKDYTKELEEDPYEVISKLQSLSSEELLEDQTIMKLLGYPSTAILEEAPLTPRGYRVLNKIPRLPALIIENVIQKYQNINKIIEASIEELDEVNGVGEIRAKKIKEGIQRIREQLIIDRHL
ncbi:DNA integrity scanning protein DisA [Lottiidibacillus patelloidae]|uniref:DNA integrity scanning protein DisA n=1 Tax=Lottiidibacillus patelloidae TaxID=2670334 RepID=A0A263BR69_9BACI|nr:DNA integrity scanning diadenylate cyclase DisA [Lottiidibacillus patelloidae]OZM55877.1 DNA integrity scanning protein DisA [Lottiidibacillus patelloidae]